MQYLRINPKCNFVAKPTIQMSKVVQNELVEASKKDDAPPETVRYPDWIGK